MKLPKFVHQDKDRYGKVRFYYRPPFRGKMRLPDDPSSDEFAEAIRAEDKRVADLEAASLRKEVEVVKENTLQWLCQQYFASPTFNALAPSTRRNRMLVINHCLKELNRPGFTGGHLV